MQIEYKVTIGEGGDVYPARSCSISVVQWFDSRADVMVIKIWALIYALLQAGRLGSCPRVYILLEEAENICGGGG